MVWGITIAAKYLQASNEAWKVAEIIKTAEGSCWTALSFPPWLSGEESACNAGDVGSTPGSGRSPGGGMAPHSSILAWEVPWTEEAGGLQSTGLQSWMQLSNHMHTGSALWKGFERRLWNVYHGPEGVREPQLSLTWKPVRVSQAPGGIRFSLLQWNNQLATPAGLTPEVPKDNQGGGRVGKLSHTELHPTDSPSSPIPVPHSPRRFSPLPPWLLGPAITDNLLLGGYDYCASIWLL